MCPELDELKECQIALRRVWSGYRPPGPLRMIGLPVRCRVQFVSVAAGMDGMDAQGRAGSGYGDHDVVHASTFVATGNEHTHTCPQRGGNCSSCSISGECSADYEGEATASSRPTMAVRTLESKQRRDGYPNFEFRGQLLRKYIFKYVNSVSLTSRNAYDILR
jgi:hypothetical protein